MSKLIFQFFFYRLHLCRGKEMMTWTLQMLVSCSTWEDLQDIQLVTLKIKSKVDIFTLCNLEDIFLYFTSTC